MPATLSLKRLPAPSRDLDPFQWAELGATAPSIEDAYRAVQRRLAEFGLADHGFAFDLPWTETLPELPPKPHRFGVMISEEWERRLEADPALSLADSIGNRFLRARRPIYFWRYSQLVQFFSESERHYIDFYDKHGLRSGAVFPIPDRRAGTGQS